MSFALSHQLVSNLTLPSFQLKDGTLSKRTSESGYCLRPSTPLEIETVRYLFLSPVFYPATRERVRLERKQAVTPHLRALFSKPWSGKSWLVSLKRKSSATAVRGEPCMSLDSPLYYQNVKGVITHRLWITPRKIFKRSRMQKNK